MKTITLTQGKVALVSDEDFEWLSQWKWFAVVSCGLWYAMRSCRGCKPASISMHRQIMLSQTTHTFEVVDHIDGNGLNNQRDNLRPASHRQNHRNRRTSCDSQTGFKGVSKCGLRFQARIHTDKKKDVHLGMFATPEEAAKAYDIAALEHFGEFARLNFPIGSTQDLEHERRCSMKP